MTRPTSRRGYRDVHMPIPFIITISHYYSHTHIFTVKICSKYSPFFAHISPFSFDFAYCIPILPSCTFITEFFLQKTL